MLVFAIMYAFFFLFHFHVWINRKQSSVVSSEINIVQDTNFSIICIMQSQAPLERHQFKNSDSRFNTQNFSFTKTKSLKDPQGFQQWQKN
jgi:hypothetical protein